MSIYSACCGVGCWIFSFVSRLPDTLLSVLFLFCLAHCYSIFTFTRHAFKTIWQPPHSYNPKQMWPLKACTEYKWVWALDTHFQFWSEKYLPYWTRASARALGSRARRWCKVRVRPSVLQRDCHIKNKTPRREESNDGCNISNPRLKAPQDLLARFKTFFFVYRSNRDTRFNLSFIM